MDPVLKERIIAFVIGVLLLALIALLQWQGMI